MLLVLSHLLCIFLRMRVIQSLGLIIPCIHQNSLVGKDQLSDEATTYNDIMGSMLSSLGPLDDGDDDDLDEDDFYRRYR